MAVLVMYKGRCLVRAPLPCCSQKALSGANAYAHVLTCMARDMKHSLNKDSVLLGITTRKQNRANV